MAKDHFTNYRTSLFATGGVLVTAALGAQVGWSHFITMGIMYGSGLVMIMGAVWLIATAHYASDPTPLVRVVALIPVTVMRDGLIWRRQHDGHAAVVAAVIIKQQYPKG